MIVDSTSHKAALAGQVRTFNKKAKIRASELVRYHPAAATATAV